MLQSKGSSPVSRKRVSTIFPQTRIFTRYLAHSFPWKLRVRRTISRFRVPQTILAPRVSFKHFFPRDCTRPISGDSPRTATPAPSHAMSQATRYFRPAKRVSEMLSERFRAGVRPLRNTGRVKTPIRFLASAAGAERRAVGRKKEEIAGGRRFIVRQTTPAPNLDENISERRNSLPRASPFPPSLSLAVSHSFPLFLPCACCNRCRGGFARF